MRRRGRAVITFADSLSSCFIVFGKKSLKPNLYGRKQLLNR